MMDITIIEGNWLKGVSEIVTNKTTKDTASAYAVKVSAFQ
jgi:hypothetical protein